MRGKQSREDSEASARDITWKDIDRERKAEKGQRKEGREEGRGRKRESREGGGMGGNLDTKPSERSIGEGRDIPT